MGLRESFINIVAKSAVGTALKESVISDLKKSGQLKESKPGDADYSGPGEDVSFRTLTSSPTKTFEPMQQAKMLKICYWLYDQNGIAHRMAERYKDFVIGDGVTVGCKDAEVKAIIDDHWNDYQNQWDIKQYQKAMELSIYGEQYYPVSVNTVNGKVRLGYHDPEAVVDLKTNPGNAERRESYSVTMPNEAQPKPFKIINLDMDPQSPTYDYLVGEAFFFSINNVSNQPRGRSDFLTIADNIDLYEQYLFNRAERADLLTRVIFDLMLKGKTDKEIKEFLKKFSVPKSMEVFGHNENVELTMKTPELGGADASSEAKLLFNHILAGAGFPPHWFAGGEGLTRATALAMDLPTKKQLKSRQRFFKFMLSFILRFQIHQSCIAGALPKSKKDTPISINLPKIEEKELETVSGALVNLANALTAATAESWITKDTAAKVFQLVLSNIGMEISEGPIDIDPNDPAMDQKIKDLYTKKTKGVEVKPSGDEPAEGNE